MYKTRKCFIFYLKKTKIKENVFFNENKKKTVFKGNTKFNYSGKEDISLLAQVHTRFCTVKVILCTLTAQKTYAVKSSVY